MTRQPSARSSRRFSLTAGCRASSRVEVGDDHGGLGFAASAEADRDPSQAAGEPGQGPGGGRRKDQEPRGVPVGSDTSARDAKAAGPINALR